MMTTPPLRNLCLATRPWTHTCISLESAADSAPGRGFTLGTMYALDEREREVRAPARAIQKSMIGENKPGQFSDLLLGVHPNDSSVDDLWVLQQQGFHLRWRN